MPSVFWSLTWAEYQLLCYYHLKHNTLKWEHTRMMMSYILNVHLGKGKKKKPQDLVKLWTDNLKYITPSEPLTEEEKQKLLHGSTGIKSST